MTLQELAERLGCTLVGDGSIEIRGVAGVEDAQAGHVTFLSNPRYAKRARETAASAILVDKEAPDWPIAQLVSANPYLDFARALELFYQAPRPRDGVHPTAVVAESAEIGEGARIGAYAVVGEQVRIGKGVVLHPHVTIYDGVTIGDDFLAHANAVVREHCRIGDRVVLQNGVVVGGDGYGFARRADGSHHKIPQAGIVVIEDDVEIQSGSCIDRAAVGETRIKHGTKIDNLVQIGHAVEIGEHNIICSQVGIAGSTTLGDHCILAGQVGVINHLTIGNRVLLTAKTGVGHDVPDGAKMSGAPELDNRQWLRCTAVYNRLPELDREVKRLKKALEKG
ncbi:MAG: UDP-3-O-(3-hydroxymyristoyl)glucosamine N-acyltransferase [Bryobacterales bacterium]|nr:UDP-3-O-(3-hydroxymyristoyl)glucosamine N-acyltransferase [Acidobacteriota bacterium]MCB9385600.1 UDP-3-O-(3-hydroxymyristoyl)glucosamine N-acyltransferase [Bryobacterales bacterium]